MTLNQRIRRVGKLCCHFLRNLAFYRAWFDAGEPHSNKQFWVNANGNFLDIAVLEWCKLFADTRSTHNFCKVVGDELVFKAILFDSIDVTSAEFDEYIIQMKTYRDKFVAHLNELNEIEIPCLEIAKRSVVFLYQYLLEHDNNNVFQDAPVSADVFYDKFYEQGITVYRA